VVYIASPEEMLMKNTTASDITNNKTAIFGATNPNLVMWIVLPTIVASMIGKVIVWMNRHKNQGSFNSLKLRFSKNFSALSYILILSAILIFPIAAQSATVNATSAGVIWGSESTDSYNQTMGTSWRKSSNEVYLQQVTAGTISSYFANRGYQAHNNQGTQGSTSAKSSILSEIQNLQNDHEYVAVVDFDHGVYASPGYPTLLAPSNEVHYLIEDNSGTRVGEMYPGTEEPENGVYDMEIFQQTRSGKIIFAFINTCMSANLEYQGDLTGNWPPYPDRIQGMPYAWTHRLIGSQMSNDGYNNPDATFQLYIGFPYGSAALEQLIPYPSGTVEYRWWVTYFFYYALNFDMSINDALDEASLTIWGQTFGTSPLRGNGFTAVWPMDINRDGIFEETYGYGSTMAVYGNGNIHIYPLQITITASSDAYSTITPSGAVTASQCDSQMFMMNTTTGYHITHVYVDSIDQGAIATYTFSNVQANHTVSVTANINTYTITPSAGSGGNISPSTPQPVNYGSNSPTFYITPNTGYHTTDVVLDSTTSLGAVSSYQFTNVQASHTIAASFAQDGTNYTLTISAGTGGTTNPSPGTYSYGQGTNVQVTATNNSGYVFANWILDGSNNTNNPITVTMNGNHNLAAYFTQQQSSPVFSDGFESADFDSWSLTVGSPSAVNSTSHHGIYSAQFTDQYDYIVKDGLSGNVTYSRAYMKVGAQPTSGQSAILFVGSDSVGTWLCGVEYQNSSGTLGLMLWETSNWNADFYPISLDQNSWHCIETKFETTGASSQATLYVDGIERCSVGGDSSSQLAQVRYGIVDASCTVTVNVDCVSVSESYLGTEEGTSPVFSDGFESGDFSVWSRTVGSPSIVSSNAHDGTYCAQADSAFDYFVLDDLDLETVYCRFYVKVLSQPAEGDSAILFANTDSNGEWLSIVEYRNESGTSGLGLWNCISWDGQFYQVTLQSGSWHCLEVKFVTDGASSECVLYVDGGEACVVDGFDVSSNTAGVRFGLIDCNYAATVNVDCVEVAQSYIGSE
jgi:hypothetical protein